HFRQHFGSGFLEAITQSAGQADQSLGGRGERTGRQADRSIPGGQAAATTPAIVIGAFAGNGPHQAQRRFPAVTLELCRLLTVRAVDAGSFVAGLFFKRSSKATTPRGWRMFGASN